MFWVGLRFPQLALDALRADGNAQACSKAFAVVDGPLPRRHVVLANAIAMKSGVRAGQPLATAKMFCPRLSATPRDRLAERQALESLAAWTYRFSAEISIAAPDTLFVEAGASLALFGGWPALERRLRTELDTFGFAYSLAAAPTATGARVLATYANGIAIPTVEPLSNALGTVPLAASGLDAKTIAALHGMGFRDLRDLFRLPRAELARRTGEDALDHLDRMRGLVGEVLPRWHPPNRFERRIEFSFGIESQAALAFPLQRLIREFALFLAMRDGGVQRFALVLGHERGTSTCVEVGLLAPQRDAVALFELARARLERIEPGAPVHTLTLRADDLPSLYPLHQDLFETGRREQMSWPALAERLHARLGDVALRGLCCVADHRPGRAWGFMPPANSTTNQLCGSGGSRDAFVRSIGRKSIAASAAPTRADSATSAKIRPFWLLRRPIPLRGVPIHVIAGPERIENGWWDEHDQRRDYYVVETRDGQRAWVFVEAGTPVDVGTASQWTLHGWFA
jgi:protein ImuB